jgi:hypothetical protein
VQKKAITMSVLPEMAKPPRRLQGLPNDVAKLKRWLDRSAREVELRAGELTPVRIPSETEERARCGPLRETFQREIRKSRHYILEFLARRGFVCREGTNWCTPHIRWTNGITSIRGGTPKCYPCTWTTVLPIIPAAHSIEVDLALVEEERQAE